MSYRNAFQQARQQPETFWAEQARNVAWYQPPTRILETLDDGTHRWFGDGRLNTCYLALDHQVEQGRGEQDALIFDSPVTGVRQRFTYNQLLARVAELAGALTRLGVGAGDGVVIYMPMVPEAAMAMLACARIGAVHSVVFGGFAANELAVRIDDARPKVILTASCGIEIDRVIPYTPLVHGALRQCQHRVDQVLVLQRETATAELRQYGFLDWRATVDGSDPVPPTPLNANHPLYIMYTSGTTGKPKGIVRDHGGHAVALLYSLRNVYGMEAGEIWWGCSDVGWVVGHSFIVYAPLLGGCTTVMFEGKPVKTPDAGAYWRLVEEYGVNGLFAAPTAFRAMRKEDPEGRLFQRYRIDTLKHLFVAGEKLDTPTYQWLSDLTGRPVYDHWWQTETGWPVTAPCAGLGEREVRNGSTNRAVPGYLVEVLGEDGQPLPPNQEGDIVLRLPLPPGCAQTLWNDHPRYLESYLRTYPGYYHTGDGGYLDEDGFVHIMGRTDDVINVAGHRLSTGIMEEHIATHSAVAESAVVGRHDELRGEVPLGLVVLKDGVAQSPQQVEQELIALIRDQVGAVACFRRALIVPRLPKTRSGKTLRAALRKMVNGKDFPLPPTIDDPAILDEISDVLIREGEVARPGQVL
ncbi:putative acetyl-coa synthetase [Alcanivorax balearicus MACL04]|uniref:Acetyl-coa synthetase n=1 Tax=Alloalcanivorax balearicus MACL04 TaxID=1177182 RepID=A0ABT2QVG4_9GAMM|nr:AMP-binding protein [Alloalcanivorax balearicus]MCU5781518.1 putative acetyl-coa synthetase [Alloalcanivorax balearicus MACL04]